jgi:D-proline reductase (dithiol) PrdB
MPLVLIREPEWKCILGAMAQRDGTTRVCRRVSYATGGLVNGDEMMRAHSATLPAPQFDNPAWLTPVPLGQAKVAIVTSAALYAAGDEGFTAGDTSYRFIDRDRRDLVLGHWSPNFDQMGVKMDLNVVYPIDRLEELAAKGIIGSVAPRHLSFAGNQPDDVSTIRLDTGPAAAAALRQDGVDVVILTPV